MDNPLPNALCAPTGRHITVIAILRDIANIRLVAAGLYSDNFITAVLRWRIGRVRLNFNGISRIAAAALGRVIDTNFFHLMPVQHGMTKILGFRVCLYGYIGFCFVFCKTVSIVENLRLKVFQRITVDRNSQQALCAARCRGANRIIPGSRPILDCRCFGGGIACFLANQGHFDGDVHFSAGFELESYFLHTDILALLKLGRSRQLFCGHYRKFASGSICYKLQFQLLAVLQDIGCMVVFNHDLSLGMHEPVQFRIRLFQVDFITHSQRTAPVRHKITAQIRIHVFVVHAGEIDDRIAASCAKFRLYNFGRICLIHFQATIRVDNHHIMALTLTAIEIVTV